MNPQAFYDAFKKGDTRQEPARSATTPTEAREFQLLLFETMRHFHALWQVNRAWARYIPGSPTTEGDWQKLIQFVRVVPLYFWSAETAAAVWTAAQSYPVEQRMFPTLPHALCVFQTGAPFLVAPASGEEVHGAHRPAAVSWNRR